jgi:uncharacterized protein with NRDE domain
MCTVSFVRSQSKVIITSNRDENSRRASAFVPKNFLVNNKNILFPKDPKAGGTWFAIDQCGTVLVLLNGALEKHVVVQLYRKSRGLILLDLISNLSPKLFWNEIDLENIEPFTLVLFQNAKLFQLQWNGIDKTEIELDATKNHIWSSSTLYSPEVRNARSSLFFDFVNKKKEVDEIETLYFHRYTDASNTENGLIINRNDGMMTRSITQAVLEMNKVTLHHSDLSTNEDFLNSFLIV